MSRQFDREIMMIGQSGLEKLQKSRVAVFGLGGVGGQAVEALARAGVGTLDIIDGDTVSISNLNRQLFALHSTVGQYKTDAAAERIRDICPQTAVNRHRVFFLPENADTFDFSEFDYVIDAIDTVAGKLEIIRRAKAAEVPVISAMGAGNKTDPTAFRVADISQTKVCPLAKVMRLSLRKEGIEGVKVVYSEEPPAALTDLSTAEEKTSGHIAPGSLSFVPPVMGLILAGEVIKDLLAK